MSLTLPPSQLSITQALTHPYKRVAVTMEVFGNVRLVLPQSPVPTKGRGSASSSSGGTVSMSHTADGGLNIVFSGYTGTIRLELADKGAFDSTATPRTKRADDADHTGLYEIGHFRPLSPN